MNAQWEDEMLKTREYLKEDLKTGASREAKRSQCFLTDVVCMFAGEERQFSNIVMKEEEDRQKLNSVLKKNGTAESRASVHTQLRESCSFQHAARAERKESLAYADGQEQGEVEGDSKHSNAMLEEAEKKSIESFLGPEKDLEQQEDLMIESSSETVGSCDFEIDNLNVFAGVAENNPSLGVLLKEVENCQAKYDEECLSDEDQDELLQQKKFIDFLLNKGNIPEEDETVMSRVKEPVDVEDVKQLVYINSQEKIVGQTLRAVTEVRNQNFIWMKSEEAVSQRGCICDKEGSSGDESETAMSQTKKESVLELEEAGLVTSFNQESKRQLLDVVKKEEENYAGNDRRHMEMSLVIDGWLSYLLKAFEQEEGIANINGRVSHAVVEAEEDASAHIYDMIASIQRIMNKSITAVRELKDNLLFVSKLVDSEQQLYIAERDAFQSIKEVWVAAVSGAPFEASSELEAEIEVRRLQLKNDEGNAAYGQQQNQIWDPGKLKTEGT